VLAEIWRMAMDLHWRLAELDREAKNRDLAMFGMLNFHRHLLGLDLWVREYAGDVIDAATWHAGGV
jgi:hypothetical protein